MKTLKGGLIAEEGPHSREQLFGLGGRDAAEKPGKCKLVVRWLFAAAEREGERSCFPLRVLQVGSITAPLYPQHQLRPRLSRQISENHLFSQSSKPSSQSEPVHALARARTHNNLHLTKGNGSVCALKGKKLHLQEQRPECKMSHSE